MRSSSSAAMATHLGQSIYLREILGREEGAPPPVDLAREKRHGDFDSMLLSARGQVTAVHDISDGGLAFALIEMALASGASAPPSGRSIMPPCSPRTRHAMS